MDRAMRVPWRCPGTRIARGVRVPLDVSGPNRHGPGVRGETATVPDFSPDQSHALDHLSRFIRDPSLGSTCVLQGLAGTGKTEVLAELARRFPRAMPCALTNKASDVLRRRVAPSPVSTFYRIVYDFRGMARDDDDPDRMHPVFA